jgi:hypothetical protein
MENSQILSGLMAKARTQREQVQILEAEVARLQILVPAHINRQQRRNQIAVYIGAALGIIVGPLLLRWLGH